MASKTDIKNAQVIRDNVDTRLLVSDDSKEIRKAVSPSQIRRDRQFISQDVNRELKRGLVKGADPYDNTPSGSKVPKDKLMSLTNSAYTTQLLEKILKSSDNSSFHTSTLKFQEQTLNYMQTISTDIKSLVEYLKPKQGLDENKEEDELKMEMSNMAKALAGLNVEDIAKEIGKSIYSKMDSGGYGDLIKTMYQSIKDSIQGGEFSQMVKGMIQNTMLGQLPKEWQANIQQFRDDPVKLMQLQLNKLGRSDNKVINEIFGTFVRKEKPNTTLQEKKIDLSAKALFDNKFYTSVTKVIPEQLYRIVAALEGHEIRMYDWEKQDYAYASEIHAKAMENNLAASPEALQKKMMQIMSYAFENIGENSHGINLSSIFKMTEDNKIAKDQITGHVKFANKSMNEILVKMLKSGIPTDELTHMNPVQVLKEIDVKWKNDSERGRILDDIWNVQQALKLAEWDDQKDIRDEVSDLRVSISGKFRDNRSDILTSDEQRTIDRIIYSDNLTAKQKDELLRKFNQRGIHTWSDNGGGSRGSTTGGSGSSSGGGGPYVGSSTSTDFEDIINTITTSNRGKLSDDDVNKLREFAANLAGGKIRSQRNSNVKVAPETEREKFQSELSRLYAMTAISKKDYDRLATHNNKNELTAEDATIFKNGGIKIDAAYKLYAKLTDAGFTAEARAKELGISIDEARARGFVSNPWELIKVIKDDGEVDYTKLSRYNMNYLNKEDMEYLEKRGQAKRRSVLGSGSIDQQISKTLTGIFGDPKIASKAGLALGGAAGLGVHKLLKSAGFMQDPKFGILLGGVGAGLMTLERSRNFINDVFGPAGDVKGQNGFTNKEIFMAKAMTRYLPMIGVGGKAAKYILKATSAFGPVGKAFGLLAAPILGYGVGKASHTLIEKGRDWLFNPDRDKNSKIAKFANFLKEIPGVKKLFALSDERNDEQVLVDSLRQTLSYYRAKSAEDKAKGGPGYVEKEKAIQKAIDIIEPLALKIKIEQEKEAKDPNSVNHGIIDSARKAIDAALVDLDNALGDEGVDLRKRYQDEQMEQRETQNRMRSASNAEYNRIGTEERERISELIGEYYNASDENAKNFRDFMTGDESSINDFIPNDDLKKRFDAIVFKSSLGEDVSDEYTKWLEDFQAADPNSYNSFMEFVNNGKKQSAAQAAMVEIIKKYLREERHETGSDTEITAKAEQLMMQHINNKSFGRILKDSLGETGAEMWAKFRARFSGVDSEDIKKEEQSRNFVKSMADRERLEETKAQNTADAKASAFREVREQVLASGKKLTRYNILQAWKEAKFNEEYGNLTKGDIKEIMKAGGRGTDPVKMKQMSKLKFATGESLGIAGCSVAAIINALVYMGIDAPEPATLIGIANKYLTKAGGVTSDFFMEVAKSLGLKASIYNNADNKFTVDVFKQFTVGKNNGLICLLKNQFSEGFHYVTIKSVSGRKLVVDDPETSGLTQTTAAEIVSRVVEIISLTATEQQTVKASEELDPNDLSSTTGTLSYKNTSSTTTAGIKGAVSDMVSNAVSSITGGGKSGGRWAGLIEALKNTVFNVRLVDDFTLPLKMGDAEAALAVSRMQIAAASAAGVGKYAQVIKKYMNNKDVQNEMKEDDLVQEAILNGGLVAGGSTGAGGRGTGTTAVNNANRDNTRNGFFGSLFGGGGNSQNPNVDGKPGGGIGNTIKGAIGGLLGATLGKVVTNGAMALPLLAHGAGSLVSRNFFKFSKQSATNAYHNLTGEITEDEAKQVFDENGNQIQRGKFKDIGGSMRTLKDATSLAKGGVLIHGGISKLIKKAGETAVKSNSKGLVRLGKAITGDAAGKGIIKTLANVVNKCLIEFPIYIADKLSHPKIMSFLGEKLFHSMIGGVLDTLVKFLKKTGQAIVSGITKKAGKLVTGGSWIKKFINKIPGGMLMTGVLQLLPAAFTGWKHAPQYLGKKPEDTTTADRFKMLFIKALYEAGPDLLIGLVATAFPVASTIADVALAVVRSIFTFDKLLAAFGYNSADRPKSTTEDVMGKGIDMEATEMDRQQLVESGQASKNYATNAKAITGVDFTAHHEGFRSKVYLDKYKNKTIGYGFNLDSGRFSQEEKERWEKYGISEEEARSVLERELTKTRADLEAKYPWFKSLDPVRQGALIDMAYNMRMGNDAKGLASFKKAMEAMGRGDYETAAKEFLDSKYARDTGKRADEIAELVKLGAGVTINRDLPTSMSTGWGSPVKGTPFVTSAFGPRQLKGKEPRDHTGVDLRGTTNDPILATKDGEVIRAGGAYNDIIIKHADGTVSKYLHGSQVLVKTGDKVKRGQTIGFIGGKGPKGPNEYGAHLHFETLVKGKPVDPFIELGLSKNNLKLTKDGSSKENWAYLDRHPWMEKQAKNSVSEIKTVTKYADNGGKPSTNKEAGGPDSNYYRGGNSNVQVINRDSALEKYVLTLDAKFNQMIELLSKLVNISQESANNIMLDGIGPARI